jgi:aconitate hydratase
MNRSLSETCLRRLDLPGRDPVWYYDVNALESAGCPGVSRLPVSIRILLESLLRRSGQPGFETSHVLQLAAWCPDRVGTEGFPFLPTRVLLQDFTGVPCIVDLAALRSALLRMGRDPGRVEARIPVDLVIDHSVQLDEAGHDGALETNLIREFERNTERYEFLRWGQKAFRSLRVLPPGLGICHQVNMEYLATCISTETDDQNRLLAFPDTVVGTDSHTVMINSMGVLGWGVGGIEAEAAMLGLPIPMLPPQVTGVRLVGRIPASACATDLALTVTARLRERGVVGHFVEFFGPGVATLSLADRAPVANMAPEYGATMGFFPVDEATLRYLRETGRTEEHVARVEAVTRALGFWGGETYEPDTSALVEIDLSTLRASVAGPRRPQDRQDLQDVAPSFMRALTDAKGFGVPTEQVPTHVSVGDLGEIGHGLVAIASISSCTNTSNPALLLEAALLARNAARRGLRVPACVKTSFAPGSRAVTAYLRRTGLLADLERLGFHVAAYGCATCIGNSGPLDPRIEQALRKHSLVAAAVLSGNRNFEGRIHPLTRANYLCSPALVVAYALAGTVLKNLESDPIGTDPEGRAVRLRDLLPAPGDLAAAVQEAVNPAEFREIYDQIAGLNPVWNALPEPEGSVYAWNPDSTYIREPPYFENQAAEPGLIPDLLDAAVLGFFGDFITTDHISPAGNISKTSPAADYLREHGVEPEDFNSYGARRGNHEVMVRGTFANIRLRNRLVDREGGWTVHHASGETVTLQEAADRYRLEKTPLILLAGKMYGAGSSRDWAAKGTRLLGVRAVIAESFERIHRGNLAGMGVLPLEFLPGASASSLGLRGDERFSLRNLDALQPGGELSVEAKGSDGRIVRFLTRCRIDTAMERDYLRHGGILPYVLRGFQG